MWKEIIANLLASLIEQFILNRISNESFTTLVLPGLLLFLVVLTIILLRVVLIRLYSLLAEFLIYRDPGGE